MQDIKTYLSRTRGFLNKHSLIWQKEVLNYYPESLNSFPENWIRTLENLDMDALYQIDGKQQYSHLPDCELKEFINDCRELEKFPILNIKPSDYPSWAWYGVRGKKKHEITTLLPLVRERSNRESILKFYDIGGGVGHLARILAHYESIDTTSIDLNKELQTKGQIRRDKYPKPDSAKSLNFINAEFGESFYKKHNFKNKTGLLGLHTCGDLASDFIDNFILSDAKLAINFGCCYLKIDPNGKLNRSQYSKSHPLTYTKYALTLATRGHMYLTREEFDFKIKVKKYRYLLHLFFKEKLGINEFVSVGDSPPRDYNQSFYDYVVLKIKENNLEALHQFNVSEIIPDETNEYFISSKQEKKFMSLLYCDIIRWQIGRILEIDLLLDRALYAQEKGIRTEVYQIFDVHQSPRNIGIILTK